jgi:flagellar hook-length control protein FliK
MLTDMLAREKPTENIDYEANKVQKADEALARIEMTLKTTLDSNENKEADLVQQVKNVEQPAVVESKEETEQKSVFVVKDDKRAENNSSARAETAELRIEDKQARVSTEANHARNEKHEGQGQDNSRQQNPNNNSKQPEIVSKEATKESAENTLQNPKKQRAEIMQREVQNPKSQRAEIMQRETVRNAEVISEQPQHVTPLQAEIVSAERILKEPIRLTNIADMTFEQSQQTQPKADSASVERVLQWESVRDAAKLGRIIQQAGQNGATKLTVRLYPEHLGRLEIQLREVAGRIDARIMASSLESRNLLVSHGEAIRQQLADKGIHIENMDFDLRDSLAKQNKDKHSKHGNTTGNNKSQPQDENSEDSIGDEKQIRAPAGLYA